jgi:hypothetical protein
MQKNSIQKPGLMMNVESTIYSSCSTLVPISLPQSPQACSRYAGALLRPGCCRIGSSVGRQLAGNQLAVWARYIQSISRCKLRCRRVEKNTGESQKRLLFRTEMMHSIIRFAVLLSGSMLAAPVAQGFLLARTPSRGQCAMTVVSYCVCECGCVRMVL